MTTFWAILGDFDNIRWLKFGKTCPDLATTIWLNVRGPVEPLLTHTAGSGYELLEIIGYEMQILV